MDSTKALQHETDFLSGVEANFEEAKGKQLRGSLWEMTRDDQSDRLRALLASNRIYDREKLRSLPTNRRIALHGFERRFLWGRRATGVAIASVLSPLSHYASSSAGDPPAVDLGELADHVRQLTSRARAPHLIGVCSPTGFTEEAKQARLDMPNVSVVLIEPDGRGGWHTMAAGERSDPRVLQLFDPESTKGKVARVRRFVEEHSADLLTGSLAASTLAVQTNLPEEIVRDGFRQLAADDPELRVTRKDGEDLLFRGAPVHGQERKTMSVVDRIKQLFSGEGDEAEKINLLAERRASLSQRRDRIYEGISRLEVKEGDLLAQGKAAVSKVPKRRLAAQLAQLRKDIGRQNSAAAMLNRQIDIISTDIHNLTLIRQGEMASLPDTEELTRNAVRAEELLETLSADSQIVDSLEAGIEETLSTEDEMAILKEFEEADQVPAASSGPQSQNVAAPPRSTEVSPPAQQQSMEPNGREPPSATDQAKDHRADAEPT